MYTLHCSLKLMKIIQRHVYTRTTRIFGIKWIIKKNKGIKALWSPSLIKNIFFFFLYKSKKNPSAAFLLSDRLNWVCSGFMKAALKFSFLINRNIKFSWEQMDPYDESSPTVRLWLSFNSQGGKAGNSWLLLGEQSPPPSSPETFTQRLISRAEGWRYNWGSETGGLTGSAQDLNLPLKTIIKLVQSSGRTSDSDVLTLIAGFKSFWCF